MSIVQVQSNLTFWHWDYLVSNVPTCFKKKSNSRSPGPFAAPDAPECWVHNSDPGPVQIQIQAHVGDLGFRSTARQGSGNILVTWAPAWTADNVKQSNMKCEGSPGTHSGPSTFAFFCPFPDTVTDTDTVTMMAITMTISLKGTVLQFIFFLKKRSPWCYISLK